MLKSIVMKITKHGLWVLSGLIISGLCLWLFLRGIEWGKLSMALSGANYFYVLPCLGGLMATYLLRALRWGSLISPVKRISFGNLFSAMSIGFMANHILPARAGEVIRSVLLGKKEDIKVTTVIATVVMERLFDTVSLIVLATVVIALLPHAHHVAQEAAAIGLAGENLQGEIEDSIFVHQLKSGIGILGGVCLVTILSLVLLDLYPQKAMVVAGQLLFFLPHALRDRLLGLLESFAHGLKILRNIRQVFWLSFLSFAIWALGIVSMYVLGLSFGIKLPFTGMCLVCISVGLAVALPQAPAYIGVFQLAVLKTLELFSVELSSAQSFAIVLWAVNVFMAITLGMFFLWKEGLRFRQLIESR